MKPYHTQNAQNLLNTTQITRNQRVAKLSGVKFLCLGSGLQNCYYKHPSTVDMIKKNVAHTPDLWSSLSQFDYKTIYDGVAHIKVVIK